MFPATEAFKPIEHKKNTSTRGLGPLLGFRRKGGRGIGLYIAKERKRKREKERERERKREREREREREN